MATTVSEFRVRFPEFADVSEYPDARVQLALDDAADCYMGADETRWCGKYNVAQAYLAAHLLSFMTMTEAGATSSGAGPITNKTAEGVSVSYGYAAQNRSDGDTFYLSTAYGQQFLILRNMCFVGFTVANCL